MHISVFILIVLIVLVTFYHFPKHCGFVHVGLHHLPGLLLRGQRSPTAVGVPEISLLQILLWEPGHTSCPNLSYLVWASSKHREPAGPLWKYSCCFTRRFSCHLCIVHHSLSHSIRDTVLPAISSTRVVQYEINKHDVSSTILNIVYIYHQWTMWMPYCTCVAHPRPGHMDTIQ